MLRLRPLPKTLGVLMDIETGLIHIFYRDFPHWIMAFIALLASVILFYKTKMYSVFVMIFGFGMYFISQLASRFPQTETISVPNNNPASEVGLSFTQLTPLYEKIAWLALPGITIGIFGLLLFAFCLSKTPNKSLNNRLLKQAGRCSRSAC